MVAAAAVVSATRNFLISIQLPFTVHTENRQTNQRASKQKLSHLNFYWIVSSKCQSVFRSHIRTCALPFLAHNSCGWFSHFFFLIANRLLLLVMELLWLFLCVHFWNGERNECAERIQRIDFRIACLLAMVSEQRNFLLCTIIICTPPTMFSTERLNHVIKLAIRSNRTAEITVGLFTASEMRISRE